MDIIWKSHGLFFIQLEERFDKVTFKLRGACMVDFRYYVFSGRGVEDVDIEQVF